MPLEQPESGWRWLHVTDGDGTELVAVSDVETYWAHWVRQPGRGGQAVRCVARESSACAWCGVGTAPRARYVLAVRRVTDGQVLLMELGRVQFTWLEVWTQRGLVGTRFRAKKSWRGRNAPIELLFCGREHVSPEEVHDISEFVGLLGREQLRLITPPSPTNPSKPAEPEGVQPPAGGVPAANGRSALSDAERIRELRAGAQSQWQRGKPA